MLVLCLAWCCQKFTSLTKTEGSRSKTAKRVKQIKRCCKLVGKTPAPIYIKHRTISQTQIFNNKKNPQRNESTQLSWVAKSHYGLKLSTPLFLDKKIGSHYFYYSLITQTNLYLHSFDPLTDQTVNRYFKQIK